MIALRIDFLAGRFHATPWSRAVNDGDIEWPPEPWRILRALVAASYRLEDCDQSQLVRILDALADAPEFLLPPIGNGHTRHYMPVIEGRNEQRVLILDSFVALERGEARVSSAFVRYPSANLAAEETSLLRALCEQIGYLGRAESWCTITVHDSVPNTTILALVTPASRTVNEGQIVRRLVPDNALRGMPLLSSLRESTADMRKAGRILPKGTTWLEYRFPAEYGRGIAPISPRGPRKVFPPSIVRFALEGIETDLRPPRYETVTVAEAMRGAVMRCYSALNGEQAPGLFTGKSLDGSPAQSHEHAFFLPVDADDDGLIDTVDVWLPRGCTHDEFRALTAVNRLYDHTVLRRGYTVTFLGVAEAPVSTTWQTSSPLVLDRFPKPKDDPSEQIRRSLEMRGLPHAEVEVWPVRRQIPLRGGRRLRTDAFRKHRTGKAETRPLIGATLRFQSPVRGPIVLGRLAHFGLGQFSPLA